MPGQVAPLTDERDLLLAYLDQQRQALCTTAYGLTDEQARRTPTRSPLSVGGLITHASDGLRNWTATVQQQDRPLTDEATSRYLDSFTMGPQETLAGIIADSEKAFRETETVVRGIADLGQPVPVPKGVPWFPDDVDAWTVRWVLLHLIEELARHAGHADIIRESIDGATGFALQAAAEGWPETPWLKPWSPADAQVSA